MTRHFGYFAAIITIGGFLLIGCEEQAGPKKGAQAKKAGQRGAIEMLKNENPQWRRMAARDLMNLPPTEHQAAMEALQAAIRVEKDRGVKAQMVQALGALKRTRPR